MATDAGAPPGQGPVHPRRPTLLVVDDEASILHMVGHIAAAAGFDIVPCAGGRQAIERLHHGHMDMAVVDLRMPEVGGLEVLRAIRDADPDCQVVLMSGDATIDSAVEAVKLGAIDYLTKPFDFARLKTAAADGARRVRASPRGCCRPTAKSRRTPSSAA